jgi:excisionase family DNA binding protein
MPAMRIDPEDWLTCTNAAQLAGVSRQYMRRLAKDGRVRSVVIDGLLFVLRADALKLSPDNRR